MRRFFLFTLYLGTALIARGQAPRIYNIRLLAGQQPGTIRILYDLVGIRATDSVAVVVNGSQSGLIAPRSVQGDVGRNLKAGTDRTIVWNVVQDKIDVDESVVVTFSITPEPEKVADKPVPDKVAANKSTAIEQGSKQPVPNLPVVQRKPSILLPVVGFAVAAGLGAYSQLMPTNYKQYQEKTVAYPTQAEIDDINKQVSMKQIAYIAAAVIVAADISYVLLRKRPQLRQTALFLNTPSGVPSLTIRRTF